MPLNSSGPISIGGPTVGQSIQLELGMSGTATASLNDANFRLLAGVASGAISLSNFYSKSAAADWLSSITYTGINAQVSLYSNAVGMDSNGTVYVDAPSMVAASRYFYKISAGGSLVFTREIAGLQGFFLGKHQSSTADSSGNIYPIGYATFSGSNRGMVTKYNSSGTVQWQKSLQQPNATSTIFYNVTVDSSGNVYVGGQQDRTGGVGNSNTLLAKYNSSGTLQWQRDFGFGNITVTARTNAVNTDSAGNLYFVTGLYVAPQVRCVAAKYNTSGVLQWQRQLDPANADTQWFNTSCVDSSGNMIVAWRSGTSNEFTIAKLNGSNGTILWQRQFNRITLPQTLTTDSAGNIYLLNWTAPSGIYITSVIKYNTSGVLQWQRQFRYFNFPSESLLMTDMAITGDRMAITGTAISADKAILDPYGGTSYGRNIFTVRLPTDGSKTGTYTPAITLGGIPTIIYEAVSLTEFAGGATSTASSFSDLAAGGVDNAVSLTTNVISTVQLTSRIV